MLNTVLIIICVLMLFAMLGIDIFISKDLKNCHPSKETFFFVSHISSYQKKVKK